MARPVYRENNDANTQEEDTKHTSISITANHTGTKALRMYCLGRVTKFLGLLMSDEAIFIGGGGANYATAQQLLLKYANRHGLIAGATGTGKTVTL